MTTPAPASTGSLESDRPWRFVIDELNGLLGSGIVERTLEVLAKSAHRDLVVPILGSALAETEISSRALTQLKTAPETRAPREILRNYDFIHDRDKASLQEGVRGRLLVACHQLLRSDQTRTRSNIASFCADVLVANHQCWEDVLPLLLVLIDDPRHVVRERARKTFVDGLARLRPDDLKSTSTRSPVASGLAVLLRRFEQHGDPALIASAFQLGEVGFDLLGRAVGEEWEIATAIEAQVAEQRDELERVVEGLFRWLRSPYRKTRDCARTTLRTRTDADFIACVADRLESRTPKAAAVAPHQSDEDYPVYRHIRWDRLDPAHIAALSDETLIRIVGYIQAAGINLEDRARRLERILPHCPAPVQREILPLLREHPAPSTVDSVTPLLESGDTDVARMATELLESDGNPHVFQLLIRQLSSDKEEVRVAAQRKLSGQSLEVFFDAFDQLTPAARRRVLPLLERIDLHFMGQLRRALRAGDERMTVLALRTVLESSRVAELEDSLLDLTVSPNPKVRATLSRTFAHVTPEAGLHYLRLFLSDPDSRVVANAVETLAELGDRRAVPWLRELEHHDHPRVRVNALVALYQLGETRSATELKRLTNEAIPQPLRKSAAWGLGRLEHLERAS